MGPPRKRAKPAPPAWDCCDVQNTRKRKPKQSHATAPRSGGISRNAARERYRVRSLRIGFHTLQRSLPSVPPNTKLSKLDVLVLAADYIAHLARVLAEDQRDAQQENSVSSSDSQVARESPCSPEGSEVRSIRWESSYLHPVRKWPIRSRLYAGVDENAASCCDCSATLQQQRAVWMPRNAFYVNE